MFLQELVLEPSREFSAELLRRRHARHLPPLASNSPEEKLRARSVARVW